MPRFCGGIPPVVGAAVTEGGGGGGELRVVEVVESGDVDEDVLARVPICNGDPAVGHDAAVFAEAAVTGGGAGLVAAQLLFARERVKVFRLGARCPKALLPAIGAVAFAGAGGDVERHLELDATAMTTA